MKTLHAFALCFTLLGLAAPLATHAETRKFTMNTFDLSGTKLWLPSTIVVNKGDDVEISATSKVAKGLPHGLSIDAFKVQEIVDGKGKTLKFKADKEGIFQIHCHLHPPHVGAQLVVLD